MASNPNKYDEYYYLTDVSTDINSHLMARITGNIWNAMKFIYNSPIEDEVKRINSLIEFVKVCFTQIKRYKIEFIHIKLDY